MFRLWITLTGLTFTIALANDAHGSTILFSDDFETPPNTVGSAPVNWNVSNNVRVEDDKAAGGVNSMFFRDGTRNATMNTAASLGAHPSIVISFDVSQNATTYEPADFFSVSIDFGFGFNTLLTDAGQLDGFTGEYNGSTIVLDSTTGGNAAFVSYEVTIPESQISPIATEFTLRFNSQTSTTGENYYFDQVVVTGIPEPASVLLLAAGGALMLSRRRS